MHASPAPQATPQAPQFSLLFATSMHWPEHFCIGALHVTVLGGSCFFGVSFVAQASKTSTITSVRPTTQRGLCASLFMPFPSRPVPQDF